MWKGVNLMEKLVREYEKDGFHVKIFAPDSTINEKAAKRVEIREKVLRAVGGKNQELKRAEKFASQL